MFQECHKTGTLSHTVSLRWQDYGWSLGRKLGTKFLLHLSNETTGRAISSEGRIGTKQVLFNEC